MQKTMVKYNLPECDDVKDTASQTRMWLFVQSCFWQLTIITHIVCPYYQTEEICGILCP